jgi:hypothetical protein
VECGIGLLKQHPARRPGFDKLAARYEATIPHRHEQHLASHPRTKPMNHGSREAPWNSGLAGTRLERVSELCLVLLIAAPLA